MPSVNRVLPSTQFDRLSSLRSTQTLSAPPTKEQTLSTITTLENRIQDTLSLGQTVPEATSQSASQLNDALLSLKTLTNSGPNASLLSVLQRFQSETLPQNSASLLTSQRDLQTQLSALPADSPERPGLELQLSAVTNTLELYQAVENLLAQSPLLQETANIIIASEEESAVEVDSIEVPAPGEVGSSEVVEASASTISAAEESSESSEESLIDSEITNEFNLPTLLNDGVIPPQTNRDFRNLDAFYSNQNSPQTIFNQRKQALLADIQTLDTQIESLQQQGGSPEDIARLERSKPLLQNLADLYGSIGTLDGTRSRDIEADAQALTDKIQVATQDLTAIATDIDTATFDRIQGQLSDLSAVATAYVQLKDLPAAERNEHNLGRFINTTYKRLGQIELGDRVRGNEPKTIAGALQTYANDKSDMATFIQRFSSLRDDIRAGNLSSDQARSRALQSIPGTSNAFQGSFLKLVDAEVALQQARQRNIEAQAALARANQNVDQANGQVESANQANGRGSIANQSANAANASGNYTRATQENGVARDAQAEGAGFIRDARGSLTQAEEERASAASSIASANSLVAGANDRLNQVEAGAFGRQLQEPVQSGRGRAGQVRSEVAASESSLTQVDQRIGETRTQIDSAEETNQTLDAAIVNTDQAIERAQAEALRRQEAQNSTQLNRLDQLLGDDAGKFSVEFSAGLTAGLRGSAEVSASLVASINGSKELDGSYTLSVRYGGEASAKFKAWIVDVEARYRFEGSQGIRLKTPAQVSEFSRLINQAITSSTRDGFTSSEASQARDELARFLASTRQEGTVHTAEIKGTVGPKGEGQRGGSIKTTVENLTTYNFEDANGNGRQDQGEQSTREVTRGLAAEANYISGTRQYGLSGKVVHYDDGRLKSAQVGIIIPSLNISENFLSDAKPVLIRAGLDPGIVDGPEVENALRQLRATKGEFKSDTTLSFNIVERNGRRTVSLAVTTKSNLDIRGSIPVSAAASVTLGTKASFESSQIIPLSGN